MALFGDERPQLRRVHMARLGDARHLEQGRGRRDVGVETARRGRHQIDGDRCARVFLGELCRVGLDPVDQRLVRRPKVRAARIVGGIG